MAFPNNNPMNKAINPMAPKAPTPSIGNPQTGQKFQPNTPGTQPKTTGGAPNSPSFHAPSKRTSTAMRSKPLAKHKTTKGKHVIPQGTFSGRAKPETEY